MKPNRSKLASILLINNMIIPVETTPINNEIKYNVDNNWVFLAAYTVMVFCAPNNATLLANDAILIK